MLRIERNGVLVEIPLEVEHQGPAAVEAYVAAATTPTSPPRAKRTSDAVSPGGAD